MYSVLMRHKVATKAVRTSAVTGNLPMRSNSGWPMKYKSVTLSLLHPAEFSLQQCKWFGTSTLHRRQRRLAAVQQVLRIPPVLRRVDVESFHALGEEGHHRFAGDAIALHHPATGDFETGVLHVDFRQGLIRRAVPGLLGGSERQQRQ